MRTSISYDNAGDVAAEVAGGADTVHASVIFTRVGQLREFALTGAAVIDGTGNAKADVITGIGTDDILSGSCRH